MITDPFPPNSFPLPDPDRLTIFMLHSNQVMHCTVHAKAEALSGNVLWSNQRRSSSEIREGQRIEDAGTHSAAQDDRPRVEK